MLENWTFLLCESFAAEDHLTLELSDYIKVESISADVTYQSEHVHYTARHQKVDDTFMVERKLVLDYPSRKCRPEYQTDRVDAARGLRADFKSVVVFQPC